MEIRTLTAVCVAWLCLAGYTALSQQNDSLATPSIDKRYREDQFYLGVHYNIISDLPGTVRIRGLSGGAQVGFLRDMPVNQRRNLSFAAGLGLTYDQFGNNLYIGQLASGATVFQILNEDVIDFDRNRLSLATIELPIEFRWRTSTAATYNFWRVYAGFRIGYAYWYRSTFKQPDNEVSLASIPEFERLRLKGTLSFGYNKINFFAAYSFNPFFKNAESVSGQTVAFRTIRVGLIVYIL
jgi:hypothetical protein